MNIVGGGAYSLGHGLIHDYLNHSSQQYIQQAVTNLNALPAKEIIFYHDESLHGLELAHKMGLELSFTPVSLLEWLVRIAKNNQHQIQRLNANVAVQLPCSSLFGIDRNKLLEDLFTLIGVTRVKRGYDYNNRLCCHARGYFGLLSGDVQADSNNSDTIVQKNVTDANMAGAEYLVTLCPLCYAAIAPIARKSGLLPIQVEDLASLALYGERSSGGLIFA